MVVHDQLSQCSGCGLCAQVCGQDAIAMILQDDGFSYPSIDSLKCINCGACKKICPFQDSGFIGEKPIQAYAVKHCDAVREMSSSGGFFTAISDYVLEKGGVIYGAVWGKDYSVTHIRAEHAAERNLMRGSKYMQSDITTVFASIKEDVSTGMPVLFTGTPCQCAAIKRIFEKTLPENLLIMDVVCHGVLPQSFFQSYLAQIQKKHPEKIIKAVNLRDKRYGWQTVGVEFADGSVYQNEQDYFYKAYAMHALQRPACFACTCASEERFSDFTVGDFWGIQHNYPELHDALGVSLVLVNTPRAKQLLHALAENVNCVAVKPEDYLPFQPNLRKPTQQGKNANKFVKYYRKHGYEKTMHRFFDVTLARRINAMGYKVLKKFLHK